jgi:hypothetical protein
MIGRAWLLLIFVVSALGGVAGSLLGNPHGMPSVGASGAITGLIGALFVVSFHHRADPAEQRTTLVTSLRFGLPALLPLAFGASSHVDYFAHAGGAITGGAIGLAVCAQCPLPTFAGFRAPSRNRGLARSRALDRLLRHRRHALFDLRGESGTIHSLGRGALGHRAYRRSAIRRPVGALSEGCTFSPHASVVSFAS